MQCINVRYWRTILQFIYCVMYIGNESRIDISSDNETYASFFFLLLNILSWASLQLTSVLVSLNFTCTDFVVVNWWHRNVKELYEWHHMCLSLYSMNISIFYWRLNDRFAINRIFPPRSLIFRAFKNGSLFLQNFQTIFVSLLVMRF